MIFLVSVVLFVAAATRWFELLASVFGRKQVLHLSTLTLNRDTSRHRQHFCMLLFHPRTTTMHRCSRSSKAVDKCCQSPIRFIAYRTLKAAEDPCSSVVVREVYIYVSSEG